MKCFLSELRKCMLRSEFYVCLCIGAVLAIAVLIEQMARFVYMSMDISSVQAAMITGTGMSQIITISLVPLLAGLAFSDIYYVERKIGCIPNELLRKGKKQYFLSKFLVNALAAFIVAIFPYLLNQLLCLIAFPGATNLINQNGIYDNPTNWADSMEYVIFPYLGMNFPLLNNFICIFLMGLWGSAIASLAFSINLFVKLNRVVAVSLTTIICFIGLIFLAKTGTMHYLPFYSLYSIPKVYGVSFSIFILEISSIFILSFGCLWLKIKFMSKVII